MIKNTHAGTGFMHESFDKDDSSKFTRKWFAWANTLFGELILKIEKELYFLTGDNPSDSFDSRKIGFVDRKDILGKVFKIL